MNDKIVVRIDSEEDIEMFKHIAECKGWDGKFLTHDMFKNVKDYYIGVNLSLLPSLGWDFISHYERNNFDIITIQEALDMFDVWIPKKGETVLAKFGHEWESVVFIAEYDGRYVCQDNLDVYFFDEIKEYPKRYSVVLCADHETKPKRFELSLTEEQVQQTIDFMKGLQEHDQ